MTFKTTKAKKKIQASVHVNILYHMGLFLSSWLSFLEGEHREFQYSDAVWTQCLTYKYNTYSLTGV